MIKVRDAESGDAAKIAEIYNQGIEDRQATMETRLRSEADMKAWLAERGARYRVVAAEQEGAVVGWASLNPFSARDCYAGVADLSIYIQRERRGVGLGKLLLEAVLRLACELEFHKIVLSALKRNEAGQSLYRAMQFREVGVYQRQGKLDGEWQDVLLMEKLL